MRLQSPPWPSAPTAGGSPREAGPVRIWSVEDPEASPVVLRGHEHRVDSVAFTQAQQLATQSNSFRESFPERSLLLAVAGVHRTSKTDGVVIPAAEESLGESLSVTGGVPMRGHEGWVVTVAFDPDGRRLASGSSESLSVTGGVPMRGHEGWVVTVAFDPDGRRLASGSWTGRCGSGA